MADLITIETFASRTARTLTTPEIAQVTGLIADASALVIDIVNDEDVTDDWDADTAPGAIVPVVVNMVRRGMDNPDGYSSEQKSDYLYQGATTTGIFATRHEAKTVRRAAAKSNAGSMNLDSYLVVPYRNVIDEWLEDAL